MATSTPVDPEAEIPKLLGITKTKSIGVMYVHTCIVK